jgi:hypothetical protein
MARQALPEEKLYALLATVLFRFEEQLVAI